MRLLLPVSGAWYQQLDDRVEDQNAIKNIPTSFLANEELLDTLKTNLGQGLDD